MVDVVVLSDISLLPFIPASRVGITSIGVSNFVLMSRQTNNKGAGGRSLVPRVIDLLNGITILENKNRVVISNKNH